MRLERRWIKWIALGVVALFVAGTLLIAPAQAGRAVKSTYHALPSPVQSLVPDALEGLVGQGIDGVTQFFAFGNPDQLIMMDLRLKSSSLAPGAWGPNHTLTLEWFDLGHGVSYEVRAGHSAEPGGLDVSAGRVEEPTASITVPGDGEWFVRVKAFSGGTGGRTTSFGPFRIDSTIPPPPKLSPIPAPPGYTFSLAWTGVTDDSGVAGYQVEQLATGSLFQSVGQTGQLSWQEDQVGNGRYQYRIRAINGAGLLSLPSNVETVTINAPMKNPGAGSFRYGIHANYTSFIKIWDISNPDRYAKIDDVPTGLDPQYLASGWGFETNNQTLVQQTKALIGFERNTMKVAEKLFVWLFNYADYDSDKLNASLSSDAGALQSAGETFDRKKGICGDLATLYITMLRIAGVPARPVHGYLDNPSAGVGDFHVWVEVWVGASLKSGDPTDTRDDWMTVDVSGAGDPSDPEHAGYDPQDLMVYFGIFNPEYLALGLNADYSDSSWNSWAQFGWTKRSGDTSTASPFEARGNPVEIYSETKNLFFDTASRRRVLVDSGDEPPGREFREYFPDVKVVSKKRIDYGVELTGTPSSATIKVRYPSADAFGAVLPWQSVVFTIYQDSNASKTVAKQTVG